MGTIKRFAKFYKPHMLFFTLDMCAALIVAAADLFYPQITSSIINDYVPNQNLKLILVWCGVLLGIYLIKAGLNYFMQYYGHVVGVWIQADIRTEMFHHLQRLPFSYFDENKTGTIMSRIINDLMEISELAHHGPEDLFLSLIMLIGSFVLLCRINVTLTLIIFALIPFIVLFAVLIRKRMNAAFKQTRIEIAEVNANVENAISGIRVSRSYTCRDNEEKKFEVYNQRFVKARSKAYKVMGEFQSSMTLFADILYLVVLAGAGLFFYFGKINIGDFVAYLLYISSFLTPLRKLISFFEQYQEGMTGFKRYEELMAEYEESEKPDALEPESLKGEIAFHNVSFGYDSAEEEGDKRMVINDLSLHIDPGKTIALVGPSGGGKTTICHLIPRFYEVDSGSITIDGIDITDMSRMALRKNIGLVQQDVFLFTGTLRENIAYGKLDASEEEIIEAAKRANIHDYVMTLKDGYDTYIGERGVKLSGGQKQRISIARVFLKNPSILILDEATSALDNATEMMIQQSLEELSKGRTSIIVAHRLSTVKNADEIIVLNDEGIAERGTHEQLLQRNGIYAALYQYQFK